MLFSFADKQLLEREKKLTVDPATVRGVELRGHTTAKVGVFGLGEQGSEDGTNKSRDTVCREDIESVVVAAKVTKVRGQVGEGGRDETDSEG